MDSLKNFLVDNNLDVDCFFEKLCKQKFEHLEDLRLLVKFPFYVEKIGLPAFQALRLLDIVTTYFKEHPESEELCTTANKEPAITLDTTPSKETKDSPAMNCDNGISSSPTSTDIKSTFETTTSAKPVRILNKQKLRKMKNFVAQQANTTWNEFNRVLSSLVNESLAEFQGTHSLRCNAGTTQDEAFHNSILVDKITRHSSVLRFYDQRFDIPGMGYVCFDAKAARSFCGNKLTHRRKQKRDFRQLPSMNSPETEQTEKGESSHEATHQFGKDGGQTSTHKKRRSEELPYKNPPETEPIPSEESESSNELATIQSAKAVRQRSIMPKKKLSPQEARIVTLRYFGCLGLSKLKEGKIRKAVKDAGLLSPIQLKAAGKDELAATLGHHLFNTNKVLQINEQAKFTYTNLSNE